MPVPHMICYAMHMFVVPLQVIQHCRFDVVMGTAHSNQGTSVGEV